jgi:alpha-aminoadipate carrier protein LysW
MWEPGIELHDACPACGELVRAEEDAMLGEVLPCVHCGAELEIIGLEPLRLELYEEEEK